jgi:stearoyl-CoA desaturase (Delta-9 desaturase)
MTRLQRYGNLAGVFVPFAGFLCAVALLWNDFVGWTDLALLALLYVATGLGITVGFHRLLTHRAFEAPAAVRYAFAVLGSMAVEGPVCHWVADHRKHHAFADEGGDPHSPHGHGPGLRGMLRGLWYAHMGWLWDGPNRADERRYAADLLEDRGMRLIDRLFLPIVLAGLAIPFAAGWAVSGTIAGALSALLWAGLVRIFLLHHSTFSINSVCHFFGSRRFVTDDQSRNVFWLALPTFGESWHHNHHAFPRSARHGLRWWELDPGAWTVALLSAMRLARNPVKITRERQSERERTGVRRHLPAH